MEFIATPKGIRFAMSGIKGVGKGVVEVIIKERKKEGAFTTLYDFFKRINTSMVGKKVAENLIGAGSFDFTGWTRQELLASVEPMFEKAAREQKEHERGVLDFFAVLGDEDKTFAEPPPIEVLASKEEILAKERELLGFFLTGHPMDAYKDLIEKLGLLSFHTIEELPHGSVCKAAFIIESLKVKVSAKSKRKFAILTISDGMERFELPIWPDIYEAKAPLFHENRLLVAILQIDKENESLRLRCRGVEDLTSLGEDEMKTLKTVFQQAQGMAKSEAKRKKKQSKQVNMEKEEKKLHLELDADKLRFSEIMRLRKIFHQFPGSASVLLVFLSEKKKIGTVEIGSKWGVGQSDQLKQALESLSYIQSFSFED